MTRDPRWRHARDILAVRLDNLGDVLLAGPALRAIKESLPEARLTLLASPIGAQAGRLHPWVDNVIEYQAPWMDPWSRLDQNPWRELAMIERLRARAFDAAIIFTSFRQSALPTAYLCYLAGIPLRHAASTDGPGSLLTSRHRYPERLMHEVERALDLTGALGMTVSDDRLILRIPDSALHRARDILAGLHRSSGPTVVLHPGCSMPARTYPWQRFARAADELIERLDATIILTGSDEEAELTARIHARMRHDAVDAAGSLDFPTFAGLIAAAELVITNNTGPMHMAAALRTPVVTLFALTNHPQQWGPWRVPHRTLYHDVPCRLCYSRICPHQHECLTRITPSMVADAAEDLLAEVATGAGAA